METNDNNNLLRPPTLSSQYVIGEPSSSTFDPTTLIVNPRTSTKKRRSKFIRLDTTAAAAAAVAKPTRKPDPFAPKITEPCSECGRTFWSEKALYGHMRCHPERPWRGVNPPPNFQRTTAETNISDESDYFFTEEDHEVAACLLMLAHTTPTPAAAAAPPPDHHQWPSVNQGTPEYSDSACQNTVDLNCGRFECASCKKVFGSHQALGGHRASHKNVKGCYAITKINCTAGGGDHHLEQDEHQQQQGWCSEDNGNNMNNGGHKCNICFRVFSSGQALGGHMRCHWEKEEQPSSSSARVFCGFDLNLAVCTTTTATAPPPLPVAVPVPVTVHDNGDVIDDASSSSPYCSGMALDLRLGL